MTSRNCLAEEQRSLSELMAQSRAMKTLVEMRTELLGHLEQVVGIA